MIKKLFHPPEYPAELPSKAGKVAYWYHWHMRLMDTGRGQIFGKVTQLGSDVTLILLIIDKLGYAKITLNQMIFFTLLSAVLIWFGGWCFVALRLDIVQQILARYRDVMFKEIYDKVKNNGRRHN